jgi:hypothetical protein
MMMKLRLAALETRLDSIALRIRTLGLARAADDLTCVAAELRRLVDGESQARS